MHEIDIENFGKIPQPSRESMSFLSDLEKPLEYIYSNKGIEPGETLDCLKNGVEFIGSVPGVETAFTSLTRVLNAKGIKNKKGGYPLLFQYDESFEHEEYRIKSNATECEITAADQDGMRRAIYFLEDRINEASGASITAGEWRRKPFIKHRISRCFFGPTYREPFFIDELTNDIDYYPEEYLNKLAHGGINGLWLSMYFRDLPSKIFPGRGKDARKRFQKLQKTVEKCARFGISIYIFFSEPKLFGDMGTAIPMDETQNHPELLGPPMRQYRCFCTSTESGREYLRESVNHLFQAVPDLGGIINIMYGEDNGACITALAHNLIACTCPLCSKRIPGEIFAENAEIMLNEMRKFNSTAEFIGWFYAPCQRDYSTTMAWLEKIVDYWPKDCGIMFNFESGGRTWQLGKERNVFDYSLAYIGPSELFRRIAGKAEKIAAKVQVGCSHENASVPFIPVPSNLYEKYKIMHKYGVYAVMQCWYFGNYPGVMNKAAGELSFEPFPACEDEFLLSLARPDWGSHAEEVISAWKLLAEGYRKFPANIAFAWYGPLHNSIVWPLHLIPVDKPIAPSWILRQFPRVSGDRIGECLMYQHTLSEALTLCQNMCHLWERGSDKLEVLRPAYIQNPMRLADIDLVIAIALQIRSARNTLKFYYLREDMFYNRKNHLATMKKLVLDEIENTRKMLALSKRDSRLGYHPEAEGYLFSPEKLNMRIKLLEKLLADDFQNFKLNSLLMLEYTGKKLTGKIAYCSPKNKEVKKYYLDSSNRMSWSASYDKWKLYITIEPVRKNLII